MDSQTPQPTPPASPRKNRRRIGLAGGEAAVAAMGLAIAAVVVGVLAASAGWTLHTHRRMEMASRSEKVSVVGRLLAQTCERLFAESGPAEAMSPVRGMLTESAVTYGLSRCRLVLADGTILADIDPTQLAKSIPEAWPTLPADAEGSPLSVDDGLITMSLPIRSSRGRALLEVAANVGKSPWADWEVQAGVGVIGAGGLIGLLLVYRAMRSHWRGLGAVRDALRLSALGTIPAEALLVSDDYGPEARAFNAIITGAEALRSRVTLLESAEKLGARSGAGADVAGACDALWQGVVLLDHGGIVRYANGAAAVVIGKRREEIVGTAFESLGQDARLIEAVRTVTSGRSRQRSSVELTRDSSTGDRTVLRATIRPMRHSDTAAAVVVFEDVTQQRVAEESRNAFVAQATHELRTPLTNMRLYVDTVVEEGDDPQVRAKCLNVISSEARRLERIVGDMLSVAEIEAGALKLRTGDVRLDGLLEELEADYRAQAQDKEITLTFELPPKLPVICADRDKLMLALHNLLGNALKYTPAGGAVTVRVRADGSTLIVDITDSGIGISEQEQELVFERFYRAKDKRIAGIAGSGIGLALARQVARLHGGEITLKSQVDKGSTFTLSVPTAPQGLIREAA